MDYKSRIQFYQIISEKRKRPLISYVTSFRVNASASIASDVIPDFIKLVQAIPSEEKEIDLLLISYGGDPTVAYRIISILRERFNKVTVLLPYTAYSAATLISLGADEIIMHPFSNLGPVDPQLTHRKQDQEQIQFGSEDLRNFIDFIRNDVGLSDQEQLQKSFEIICKEVGAVPIGVAKRSAQLALSMGEKLLSMHMSDGSKAKSITETLNKSFYHHGYPLGRTEAKKMGLPVIHPDTEMEQLLWKIYESFETEMKFNDPFDPLKLVLNTPEAAGLLEPSQMIQIPRNLPPEILQEVYNAVINQIKIVPIPPVDFELFQASTESIYGRSEFKTCGKVFANKLADMNISINMIQTSSGWTFTKNT